MTRQPSTITSSRHPATVGLFAAAALAGAWGLFIPGGQSNALDDALPEWFSGLYYAGFGLGGVLGLIAMCLPQPCRRARAERCAWYVVGWFCLMYAVAAFTYVGAPAGQSAICVGMYSPIATYRIVQIGVQRRRALRDAAAGRPADPPPLGRVERTDG